MKKLDVAQMEQVEGGRRRYSCGGKLLGTVIIAFLVGGPAAAIVAGSIVGLLEC